MRDRRGSTEKEKGGEGEEGRGGERKAKITPLMNAWNQEVSSGIVNHVL